MRDCHAAEKHKQKRLTALPGLTGQRRQALLAQMAAERPAGAFEESDGKSTVDGDDLPRDERGAV